MKLLNLRHRAEYFIFRCFVCLIGVMNTRQVCWVANRLADAFVYVLPAKLSRYDVAEENLRAAYSENLSEKVVRETIHAMWVHLFRLVAEMIQAPRYVHLDNCRESIIYRDRAQVIATLATGRPVILLSGHYGNWEISMSTFGHFGVPMGIIARALDNPYLHEWFKKYREASGHKQILKRGGFDELLDVIAHKGCVGLLADQDAGPRGLFVDFFGQPASTFKSIALLAREYDALICVGYARRMPDEWIDGRWSRYEVGCMDVIDPRKIDAQDEVREMTQRYTSALEQAVRFSPEQYFWVHKRWKSKPKSRGKAVALPEAA